jgi:hypothetical protein
MRSIKLVTMALVLLAGSAGLASAASYGDFVDPSGSVHYLNVQDANGLFGAPTVSLNSLDFTPTTYNAQCTQCPGGVTTADILTLDIQTTDGLRISEINVTEGLDYALQSFDASGYAIALVMANLFIDISEVDGVAVNGLNEAVSIVFSPTNGGAVNGIGITSGVILGSTGAIDILGILDRAGVRGNATRVSISLDNTLQVFHEGSGGSALIRKRDTDFVSFAVTAIDPIPEPTTALMILGGLAGLAARRPAAR